MAKMDLENDKTVVDSSDKTVVGSSSRTVVDDATSSGKTSTKTGTGSGLKARATSVVSKSKIPETIGKYRNIRALGAGGMGAVYLGDDPELKRTVVIKTLLKTGGSKKARFIREAAILSQLTSQRIVRFYETLEIEKKDYVVLEYVEGMDLGKVIEKDGKLPPEVALWALREVCRGLEIAHHQNIVHRDIKPANILISKGANIKIADFGISGLGGKEDGEGDSERPVAILSSAKVINDDITVDSNNGAATSMGTLSYMAPEQMEDAHEVDTRADIYPLGVMLYEMVTGSKPYNGDSLMAQHDKIMEGKYINPSKFTKRLPGVVKSIIKKCLKFDKEKRYSNVGQIVKKIDRYLKGFNEKEIRQEVANSIQQFPNSQYKYRNIEIKNKLLYKILAIVLASILAAVGIFALVRSGFNKGVFQKMWPLSKNYTPVTLHLNFPEIINAGSGFAPKAYFYTYDDSGKEGAKVVGKEIEIGNWINPHTKVETILDSSEPENLDKADQVPYMEFFPDDENPNVYSTKTIFLHPGTYRMKICMGPAVWWKTMVVNNYVKWAKNGKTGEVDEYLKYSLSEGRILGFARPVVIDRNTGEELKDCSFKITYNHSGTQDVAKIVESKNKSRTDLTAEEVESFRNDKWLSLITKTKNKGKEDEEKTFINPVIEVFVSCEGYRTERFGLSTDWYQDKIFINAALEKKE